MSSRSACKLRAVSQLRLVKAVLERPLRRTRFPRVFSVSNMSPASAPQQTAAVRLQVVSRLCVNIEVGEKGSEGFRHMVKLVPSREPLFQAWQDHESGSHRANSCGSLQRVPDLVLTDLKGSYFDRFASTCVSMLKLEERRSNSKCWCLLLAF